MKGKIISSNSGWYFVEVDSQIYKAKPIGLFRKDNLKVVVGDIVELMVNDSDYLNVITKIYPRKNYFIRPNVANIDIVLLVMSVIKPKFNDYYLDKLITFFQCKNVKPILIFTKLDLIDLKKYKFINEETSNYQKMGYDVFYFKKNFELTELQKLKKVLNAKTAVISGPSGVGKSTILNYLDETLKLSVGEVSKGTERGKHTTRKTSLFKFFDNFYIIDSPGFTSFEIDLSKDDLAKNFLNFNKLAIKCKYNNCLHLKEKDCYVKDNFTFLHKYKNYEKLQKEIT